MRKVRAAPYGGLFLTLAAARLIGPPRADFVLYGDDHEYTRRLGDSGVALYLTDFARIHDVDRSWNLGASKGSRWIDADAPPWRIYYAARNHVYLERTEKGARRLVHRVNGAALTARLLIEALLRYRSLPKAYAALAPFRRGGRRCPAWHPRQQPRLPDPRVARVGLSLGVISAAGVNTRAAT